MWLLLLTVLPIALASERIGFTVRLRSHKNLNVSSIPIHIQYPGEHGEFKRILGSAQNVGNNSYKAQLTMSLTDTFSLHPFRTVKMFIEEKSFLQQYVEMNLKLEGVTHMKMTTDDYKLHVSGTVDKYSEETYKSNSNGCGCVTRNCACCEKLDIPKLKFEHTICANISYNEETIGIDLAVGVDGYYYVQEISARNPPPICFDVPGAKEIASVCLAFKKLDLTKKHLSGCAEVELELVHMRVAHLPLGCFDMPI